MTDIIAPPAPIVPPTFPDLGNPAFNAMSYDWGVALPGVSVRFGEMANATHQLAIATQERAVLAAASASAADDSAQAAALDAARLATLDALWLGASATDPTTGKGGAPLVAGNAYVNTVSGAVRAYNEDGVWVQGVYSNAGVASLNGASGVLALDTLAKYGITDIATGANGAADLNALIVSGMYSYAASTNAPPGAASGVIWVSRTGSSLGQIAVAPGGAVYSRGATGIGGTPSFSAWKRVALHDDAVIALAGGAIDCSLGNYFTEAVSANRTFAFANIPSGAYSCVLEINHTAGAVTMPGGTVFSGGSAPTLTAGKRHLIFFQRAATGTAGWLASALTDYAA